MASASENVALNAPQVPCFPSREQNPHITSVLSDHVNTSTDCSDLCRLLSSCPGRPGRCNVPHYNTGNDDFINIPPLWRHSTVTFFILRGFIVSFYCINKTCFHSGNG